MLLSLGVPCVHSFSAPVATAQPGDTVPAFLARIQVKRVLSGVMHNGQVIPQSQVVEISDYPGVRMSSDGVYAAFVGSAWSDLEGTKAAVSVVTTDGREQPAELVGFDERVSLAVVRVTDKGSKAALLGSLKEDQSCRVIRLYSKGRVLNYPMTVLRVMDSDLEAEREIRVQVPDEFPQKGEMAGSPLLDGADRFLGFVTLVQNAGLIRSVRSFRVIPVQAVKESLKRVIQENGTVRAGWLGVFLDDSTDKVRILQVVEDGPAAKAGVLPGDLVLKVKDATIWSKPQFVRLIRWNGPDREVRLTLERGGTHRQVKAMLERWPLSKKRSLAWAVEVPKVWTSPSRPEEAPRIEFYPVTVEPPVSLGLAVDPLTPQLARFFKSPSGKGLLVKSVLEGSPASRFGFQAGDVLIEIDGVALESAGDVGRILDTSPSGEVVVTFVREGVVQTRKVLIP